MSDEILDLDLGLRELATLLLDEETVETTMSRVATVACRCVSGGTGASVALTKGGSPYSATWTDDRVRAVDDLQYEALEGPGVDALKTGEVVIACDVASDDRYPDLGPKAAAMGIRSILSAPLRVKVGVVGTLNVFSERPEAFDDAHVDSAELPAGQAAAMLANVRAHEECGERIRQLQEALDSRVVIEQAKGMLMERHRIGPDAAFDRLRERSQRANRRLRLVAADLVCESSVRR